MSFGDELRRAAEGNSDFDPPDGNYTVTVIDTYAGIARSGNQDRFAKAVLQIVDGEYAGRQFPHFMSLSERATPISAEALMLYGVWFDGIEDIDDLSLAMDKIVGVTAEITVVHRSGFTNVKVHRTITGKPDIPVDTGGPPSPAKPTSESFASAASRNDDDIPF